MYCPKCGKELPDGTFFCTGCGESLFNATTENYTFGKEEQDNGNLENAPLCVSEEPIPCESADDSGFLTMKKMFSSSLFLAICIVLSVCVAAVSASNLIAALLCIGCWIVYANAKSASPLKQNGYKVIYIAAKISYIINWVIMGIGIAFGTAFTVVYFSGKKYLLEIAEKISEEYPYEFELFIGNVRQGLSGYGYQYSYNKIVELVVSASVAIIAVLTLFEIVSVLIYNLCFIKPVKNYADNLTDSFATGIAVVYDKKAANALLAFGIICVVLDLFAIPATLFSGEPLYAVSILCGTALHFMGYALINKAK